MASSPVKSVLTDTVIITSPTREVCSSPLFDELVQRVQTFVVDRNQIYGGDAIKVVALPGFRRLLVISPSREVSEQVHALGAEFEDCVFGYSLTDHHVTGTPAAQGGPEKQYLRVPEARTLFLVSPPASPPPGFDYSRLEDNPNMHTGHAVDADGPLGPAGAATRTVFDNGRTQITVQQPPVAGAAGPGFSEAGANPLRRVKTALPPVSTFDDILDDNDGDPGNTTYEES